MQTLWSAEGQRVLESYLLSNPVLALDFDGTLARIVDSPMNARMSAEMERALIAASAYFPIAIISGRSRSDLRDRLPTGITRLIGNHGMEEHERDSASLKRASAIVRRWIAQMSTVDLARWGTVIEDKRLSLALHYRGSRNRRAARRLLLAGIPHLRPAPRVIPGKCVFNLIPPGAPHKGMALLGVLRDEKRLSAIYVGDDDTDEDVFSLEGVHLCSVRVRRHRNSAARFYVSSVDEVARLLQFCAEVGRRLGKRSARKIDSALR